MKSILQVKKLLRPAEMTSGLVNAFLCTLLQFPLAPKKIGSDVSTKFGQGGKQSVYGQRD